MEADPYILEHFTLDNPYPGNLQFTAKRPGRVYCIETIETTSLLSHQIVEASDYAWLP